MIFCCLPGLPGVDFRLVQTFYDRPDYYRKYGLAAHAGYDLAPMVPGTRGVIVYAPHDGLVLQRDFGKAGYGRHAEIVDLAGGRASVCAHFERFFKLPADGRVRQGDPVGVMGMTGDATGVHVHFDFRRVDQEGNTLGEGNGFSGRIPVGQYVRLWHPGVTLCAPGA